MNIWMALFVPARTPREAVDKLSRALEKVMKDPAVVTAADKAGLVIDYHDPEGTRKLIESEHQAVKKVVDKLGIGKR